MTYAADQLRAQAEKIVTIQRRMRAAEDRLDVLTVDNTRLTQRLLQAEQLMQKFVNKVEAGAARSVETYGEFKAFLSENKNVKPELRASGANDAG